MQESAQFYVRLTKVTSFIIISQQSHQNYQGTVAEIEQAYKKVQTHNLLLGWWSIFGLIWTPMALYRNAQSLKKLRELQQ